MPLLRFDNVTLHRGGRLLFEGLTLQLLAGQALQVAGPNGSGKSSLIRLAAGLLRPSSGRVERPRLALADDKIALDPELSVARALRFWLGTSADSALQQASAALNLTRLEDVPVRLLSTGQLKRATLARVAASGAPLWLLDEPLNGLDEDGRTALARLIERHLGSGGAVLAASHVPLAGDWSGLELGR